MRLTLLEAISQRAAAREGHWKSDGEQKGTYKSPLKTLQSEVRGRGRSRAAGLKTSARHEPARHAKKRESHEKRKASLQTHAAGSSLTSSPESSLGPRRAGRADELEKSSLRGQ